MKFYLYLLFILMVAFLLILSFFIIGMNPYNLDLLSKTIFFVVLFGALCSAFTLLFFYIRIKLNQKISATQGLKLSLRQAALFTFIVVGLFLFLVLNILNLWTITLYFAILILVELIIKAK